MQTARFERRDLAKAFFWLDLLVVGIFAVALIALVRDAYLAGFYQARDDIAHANGFWSMLRDSAFVIGALGWLMFRHFRDGMKVFADPWAQ